MSKRHSIIFQNKDPIEFILAFTTLATEQTKPEVSAAELQVFPLFVILVYRFITTCSYAPDPALLGRWWLPKEVLPPGPTNNLKPSSSALESKLKSWLWSIFSTISSASTLVASTLFSCDSTESCFTGCLQSFSDGASLTDVSILASVTFGSVSSHGSRILPIPVEVLPPEVVLLWQSSDRLDDLEWHVLYPVGKVQES